MLTNLFHFSMLSNGLKFLELKSSPDKTYEDLSDYSRIEEQLCKTRSLFITATGEVHPEYQDNFNKLGIRTDSWVMILEDQQMCEVILPSNHGVKLNIVQNTNNVLSIKTWELTPPSRRVNIQDFSKLLSQNLTTNEKLLEITKLVSGFWITPQFQSLLKYIGVIKSKHDRCHASDYELEYEEILIE